MILPRVLIFLMATFKDFLEWILRPCFPSVRKQSEFSPWPDLALLGGFPDNFYPHGHASSLPFVILAFSTPCADQIKMSYVPLILSGHTLASSNFVQELPFYIPRLSSVADIYKQGKFPISEMRAASLFRSCNPRRPSYTEVAHSFIYSTHMYQAILDTRHSSRYSEMLVNQKISGFIA